MSQDLKDLLIVGSIFAVVSLIWVIGSRQLEKLIKAQMGQKD